MTTQRQARAVARRELLLLATALDLAEREGIEALQLGTLAEMSEYSKGTVYGHFASREDLISGLCVVALRYQLAFFGHAAAIEGGTRLRITAMHAAYLSYAERFPTLFLCVLTALTPAIRRRSAPARLAERAELDRQLIDLCDRLVLDGLDAGDIPADKALEVRALSFANRSLSFGSIALLAGSDPQAWLTEPHKPKLSLRYNVDCLLDGVGWAPTDVRDSDREADWDRVDAHLRAWDQQPNILAVAS